MLRVIKRLIFIKYKIIILPQMKLQILRCRIFRKRVVSAFIPDDLGSSKNVDRQNDITNKPSTAQCRRGFCLYKMSSILFSFFISPLLGTKKSPDYFSVIGALKTAAIYSPTLQQYHRRGQA